MKKALPGIIVLAIVVAAVAFFLNRGRNGGADMAPGRAAELAPEGTLLFVEVPDMARTAQRWKGTALHAISQEPEWVEFMGKWEDFKAGNEVAKAAFGVVADIEKADPAGIFLAVKTLEAPMPKFAGGFPYRGKKSSVEGVIRQLKEQIFNAFPAAKSEISKLEGTEVETLTDASFTAVLAFRDNWFLFASDVEEMGQLLKRYAKTPDAPPSLASDALFVETLKRGQQEPDLVLWARWSAISDKLNALAAMAGGPSPEVQDPNPTQAMLYTGKLDGKLMRDQVYMHTKEPMKAGTFANRSLAFTQAATYAYVVSDYSAVSNQMKAMLDALKTLGVADQLAAKLEPKGLKVEDIFTTFGPELALMSAWEGGAVFPDFFAAAEVKDASKARLFAETIGDEMGLEVEKSEKEGTAFWTLKEAGVGPIQPTLAVNEKHLMFGLNAGVILSAMKQMTTQATNLQTAAESPYPAALKTVVQPNGGLVYVDAKLLFEKLYDKVKPFVAMSLVGDPDIAKHFDAGKLPQAETISRHLAPMIVSFGTGEHGWKIESTGTISFIGSYGIMIPAGLFLGGSSAPMATPVTPMPPPGVQAVEDGSQPTPPAVNPPRAIRMPLPTLPAFTR